MRSNRFWLVQRLTPHPNPRRTGVDSVVRVECMGSAEFEFGALPESLKRMRNGGHLVITELDIDGRPIFFITGQGNRTVHDDFLEWLTDPRGPRSKDLTYFPEVLAGTQDEWVGTGAWWSVLDDVMWTMDKTLAINLLDHILPA